MIGDSVLDPGPNILPRFLAMAREFPTHSRVLHTGTARSDPGVSTLDRQVGWFDGCDSFHHVGTDMEADTDVDLVCDIHEISCYVQEGEFDIIVSCSTFEHLVEPWVAAEDLAYATRSGGLIFCQSHLVFPEHGYPSDYWRFTTEAMRVLFSPKRGWKTLYSGYEFPCEIIPPREITEWNRAAPAFLNVCCVAQRL